MNTTKTTNLGRIARYLYEKYGLKSRLISADNEYDTLEDLIGAGVIEPFAIVAVPNPFPVMTKLSMGQWPVIEHGIPVMRETPPAEMAKIGAYLIEGTTTIAELLHQDHIRKARKIGEDLVGKFEEDGITFAKSAQSHYGHVQDFVTLDLIPRFSMLPVQWVWWTGHEYAGEDEATGQTRLGPGVVGKAATMKVPRKMGNTFHFVSAENIETDARTHKSTRTTEYRAYFEPHSDAQLVRLFWPAGVKLPVTAIPKWRERFPGGYIPLTLTQGVEQYIEFHDTLAKQDKLVITPGAGALPKPEITQGVKSGEATSAPAPVPAATQTRPPYRGYQRPPLPRTPTPMPIRVGGPYGTGQKDSVINKEPEPEPSLEETLKKSIEAVTGEPVVVPDINAVPVPTEKGE